MLDRKWYNTRIMSCNPKTRDWIQTLDNTDSWRYVLDEIYRRNIDEGEKFDLIEEAISAFFKDNDFAVIADVADFYWFLAETGCLFESWGWYDASQQAEDTACNV